MWDTTDLFQTYVGTFFLYIKHNVYFQLLCDRLKLIPKPWWRETCPHDRTSCWSSTWLSERLFCLELVVLTCCVGAGLHCTLCSKYHFEICESPRYCLAERKEKRGVIHRLLLNRKKPVILSPFERVLVCVWMICWWIEEIYWWESGEAR